MLTTIFRATRKFLTRDRLQISTTTGFFRNDRQMATLLALAPQPKVIYFFGCSDGCEPYTFAIHLKLADPACTPSIRGLDINEACIEKARLAVYDNKQMDYYRTGQALTAEQAQFFEKAGAGTFRVKNEITRLCDFEVGSVLDGEAMAKLPPGDLVFCQNVLVHLSAEQNVVALQNLKALLKPTSLLVIGGMRPEVRCELTRELQLEPVTTDCRPIHDGWRDLRKWWDESKPWAREYFCLEPFCETEDWPYRYSSLFRLPSQREG